MEKSFLKSKTLWVNALVLLGTTLGISELTPDFSAEVVVGVVTVANIVLRFMTKSPITLV